MYKCDVCGRQTKPHEACNIVVVETRPQTYTRKVFKGIGDHRVEKELKSFGREIVRTQKQCDVCVDKSAEIQVESVGYIQETSVNVK